MRKQPSNSDDIMALQQVVEAVYIPITAALTAFGIAASGLRILALISGLHSGWLPYLAIAIAALGSVLSTTAVQVLGLPRLLHAGALLIVSIITLLLLILAPTIPGELVLGGQPLQISLLASGMGLVWIAWFSAMALSWVVAWVYPTYQSQPKDETLAQRLESETELRRIYSGGVYNQLAQEKSGRAAYRAVFGLLLLYLLVALFWPDIPQVGSDVFLATLGGITMAAILAYLALVGLSGLRRSLEKQGASKVLPGYHRAWLYGVLLVAVVAGGLGTLLPANISPLARLDYNVIMDRLTVFLVGLFFQRGSRQDIYNMGVPTGGAGYGPSMTPLGGGGGDSGPISFLVVLLFPALAYMIYRGVKSLVPSADMVLSNEVERSRGLLQILKALFTWPWRWLKRLFGSKTHRDTKSTDSDANLVAQLQRSLGRRRGHQYPDDPALYIRYTYARMLQAAAKAGYKRHDQQTAHEYAHTLAQQVPDAGDALVDLTQTYCDVRYTKREPAENARRRAITLLRRVTGQFRMGKRIRDRQAP